MEKQPLLSEKEVLVHAIPEEEQSKCSIIVNGTIASLSVLVVVYLYSGLIFNCIKFLLVSDVKVMEASMILFAACFIMLFVVGLYVWTFTQAVREFRRPRIQLPL